MHYSIGISHCMILYTIACYPRILLYSLIWYYISRYIYMHYSTSSYILSIITYHYIMLCDIMYSCIISHIIIHYHILLCYYILIQSYIIIHYCIMLHDIIYSCIISYGITYYYILVCYYIHTAHVLSHITLRCHTSFYIIIYYYLLLLLYIISSCCTI